jgi:vitamin B12 transporter
MERPWSFIRYVCFLGLFFSSAEAELRMTIPGLNQWQNTVEPTAYKPTHFSETPGEALNDLEALPSLNLKTMGGNTQVSFRGQTARNTLIIIDGIVAQDIYGAANISSFLGGATQIRDIIPGSQGVRYGSGASGGTILMETPYLPAAHLITAEYGSFQSAYGHLAHQKTTPETAWVIHAEGNRTAGLPQYGPTRSLGEKSKSYLGNVATRLEHRLSHSTTLKLTGRTVESSAKYDSYETYTDPLPKPQGTLSTNVSLVGIGFETSTQKTVHAVQGFFSQTKLKYTASPTALFSMNGINYTGTYAPRRHLDSTLLVGIREDRIDHSYLIKKNVMSGYVGGIQKICLTEQLSAEAGLRLDQHEKFGSTVTYSGALAYTHHHTTLKSSLRTGFLNPSLYTLYATNPYVQNNPRLNPEHTRTLDMTLEHTFPRQDLTLQVTPFWTQATQLIHSILTNNRWQSVNVPGTTKISGIESQLFYRINPSLNLTTSYAYTNIDASQPNTNPEFPKHKAHLRLDYMPTLDFSVSPDILYVGARTSRGGEALKEYTLLNLTLKYEPTPGFSVFGRIENVCNIHYMQTYNYQTPRRAFYVGTHFYF